MVGPKKIFIVDDDCYVASLLEQILNSIGYNDIFIYPDGRSCIDQLDKLPEVIFLDYQMDEMNGLEVLKVLRNYLPESSVVFTTSLEDLSIALESIAHGSFEFLLKKNLNKTEVKRIMEDLESA